MDKKRNSFSGSIGFVLAAAGSAVGLGNIWRFPYLAAKGGGGLFLVVYLVLALTFGYTLLTTEISIGRKTKKGPLTAYGIMHKKSHWIGIFACIVPMMIMPYYCAIGGWVIKYFVGFLTGEGLTMAEDGYFTGFITSTTQPILYTVIFLAICTFIILRGVNKGIESMSRVLMPILLLLVVVIAFFSLTISHTDADGVTRTGMQGLKIFVIPDFTGMTVQKFFSVLMDAMGQLFYSLSVAMGIMVAYGSYVRDEDNLGKSINQIEIFDTGIAVLAGIMVIPAVYAFQGQEGMSASGPGLMFVSLPKVFAEMGSIGRFVGILFFAMVLFAAVTSAVSIMEAIVSSFIDEFHLSRKTSTWVEFVIALVVGITVCLGYNKFYFEFKLPNGAVAQVLDILDYVSNNVFMPVVAIATCILIGWILKPQVVIDEVEKSGCKMGRKGLYRAMIKFIAPILLLILLLKALGIVTFI